jgi:hypothetical protein
MVKAGKEASWEWQEQGGFAEDVVKSIYRAMRRAKNVD